MKRDNVFWGTALIIVGVLLFLQTQGIITNVFRYFWPLALILVGSWIILNVYWRPARSAEETFIVPLGAARSARFRFSHGAGQIEISGGAPVGQALVGSSGVGMNQQSRFDGDRLEVKVEAGPTVCARRVVPATHCLQGRATRRCSPGASATVAKRTCRAT